MAKTKKNKHNFWKRVHFKYRLSIMNESTLEEIWKIKASIFSGAMLLFLFAFVLVTVTSIIIITTPIRYYLPGYLDSEVREKAIISAIKADSLEQQLKYQEAYIRNMRSIFDGTLDIDSVKTMDTISVSENDPLLKKSKLEEEYNKRYEEEERYNLSVLAPSGNTPMEGLSFYKPVKGIITSKFSPAQGKFGITIKTEPKTTVLSVLEGIIIFSGYDINSGYTIQVQHKNGFVSIYKNNTSLLKATGNKVKTGEAIALAETNDKKDIFIEFELWYKGSAINPEDYIFF